MPYGRAQVPLDEVYLERLTERRRRRLETEINVV
jgi:hypothetical protein